jgi:hypothetical protein
LDAALGFDSFGKFSLRLCGFAGLFQHVEIDEPKNYPAKAQRKAFGLRLKWRLHAAEADGLYKK